MRRRPGIHAAQSACRARGFRVLLVVLAAVVLVLAPKATVARASEAQGSIRVTATTAEPATYEARRIATEAALPVTDALDWEALAGSTMGDVDVPAWGGSLQDQRSVVEAVSRALEQDDDGSLAARLAALAQGAPTCSVTAGGEAVAVEDGWYLLTASGRRPLLAWVRGEAVTLQDKADVPTLEKGIVTAGGILPSTTAGAGDVLTYQLTYLVPQSYEAMTTYQTAIHDRWDGGLALGDGTVRVVLVHGDERTDVTSLAEVRPPPSSNADTSAPTLTVSFADLHDTGAVAGDTLEVTYQLVVGEGENPGSTGLLNRAWATYPSSAGTGTTVPVSARTYAAALVVHKLDGATEEPLAHAAFALADAEGRWLQADGTFGAEGSRAVAQTDSEGCATLARRLDAGTYVLVELSAPDGYELPANPTTTVTIEMDAQGQQLVLSATAKGGTSFLESVDAQTATVTLRVDNAAASGVPTGLLTQTGDDLPSHLLLGVLLGVGVAAVAVSVALRRRARASNESHDSRDRGGTEGR